MTPDEKDDLAASLSLDMANARAERWRVRTMEARSECEDAQARLRSLLRSLTTATGAARSEVAKELAATEQFLAEAYTVDHGAGAAVAAMTERLVATAAGWEA